jgi:C1A family cysteine protease
MPTTLQVSQLGWSRDLPDPRDQLFSPDLQQIPPPSIDLTPPFDCYDQGRIGSCTANALAAAIQFGRAKAQEQPAFLPSRLFIYYNERVIDGDPGNDGGSTLRTGLKSLQQQGVCPESDWTYDDTAAAFEGAPFPVGSKPATHPTQACYNDAAEYVITSYQRIYPQNLPYLQACLASGYPFVFGFSVFASWYNTKPTEIPYPTGNDSLVGGHAVMCVGYDNASSLFKIRNSWGTGVGERGYFYMPYSYLTDPTFSADFWVIDAVKA